MQTPAEMLQTPIEATVETGTLLALFFCPGWSQTMEIMKCFTPLWLYQLVPPPDPDILT